jgi:hypothetical protein
MIEISSGATFAGLITIFGLLILLYAVHQMDRIVRREHETNSGN